MCHAVFWHGLIFPRITACSICDECDLLNLNFSMYCTECCLFLCYVRTEIYISCTIILFASSLIEFLVISVIIECYACVQVLASFINPGGLIPKHFDAAASTSDECSEKDDADESSLPAMLPELLTQSCLVPALSSYLRNDSGTDCLFVSTHPSLMLLLNLYFGNPPNGHTNLQLRKLRYYVMLLHCCYFVIGYAYA